MEYLLHILILVAIYAMLSASLDLIAGYTGLLSISHAAFYGLGAYGAALMALNVHSPFWANIICALILAGVVGVLVGMPSLRIRDDYFAIATFAFQVITFSILNNWVSLTGGPMGLSGIPRPVLFGAEVSSHVGFLVLTACACAVLLWSCHRIVDSPFGRVLRAIREDEMLSLSAGKNIGLYKLTVFMIGAGMAALAGSLYAYYVTFIDPTSFTVVESVFIISLVIIGGAGSLWGPVAGSVALVVLPELLRFIGLPSSVAANVREILYGGLLVVLMLWRPQGLLGQYSFEKGDSRA